MAAWAAPRLARGNPLGGVGPLGPLPGRVQRRGAQSPKQVADPFHVVRLGNDALDDVRRRVQNQTLGHRGRKDDPLYRARKLLVSASENITENGHARLRGLLDAGDPYGEVRDAWHAKETLRAIYDIADHQLGIETVNQLAADLQDPGHARRDQPARAHHHRLENPDLQLARRPGHQRPHRGSQQPDQTRQTRRLRIHQLRQLQNPGPALRRQTQLGAPRNPHSDLKREEPYM